MKLDDADGALVVEGIGLLLLAPLLFGDGKFNGDGIEADDDGVAGRPGCGGGGENGSDDVWNRTQTDFYH